MRTAGATAFNIPLHVARRPIRRSEANLATVHHGDGSRFAALVVIFAAASAPGSQPGLLNAGLFGRGNGKNGAAAARRRSR